MDIVEKKTEGSDMDWDAAPEGKIHTAASDEGESVRVDTAGEGQSLAQVKSTLTAVVDKAEEKSTLAEAAAAAAAVDSAAEKPALAAMDLAAEKSAPATAVDSKQAADAEMAEVAPETTSVAELDEVGTTPAGDRKEGLEERMDMGTERETKAAVAAATVNLSGPRLDLEHRCEDGASPGQGKSGAPKNSAMEEATIEENQAEVRRSDDAEAGAGAVEIVQTAASEDSLIDSSSNEMKRESVHPNKTDDCAEAVGHVAVGPVETVPTEPDAGAEIVVVDSKPLSETDGMQIESSDVNLTNQADIAQEDLADSEVTLIEDLSIKDDSATKNDVKSTTNSDESGLADSQPSGEKASIETTSGCAKDMTIDEGPPHQLTDTAAKKAVPEETIEKAGDEAVTRSICQAEASDVAGMNVNEAKPSGDKASKDEVDGPEATEEDQLKLANQKRELRESEEKDTKQPSEEADMECGSATTAPDDPANSQSSAINEEAASAATEGEAEKIECETVETNGAAKTLSDGSDTASALDHRRENQAEESADKATRSGEDGKETGAATSLPRAKRKLSSEPDDEADNAEHSQAQEKKSKIEDEANEQLRTENITEEPAPLIQDAEMSEVAEADRAEKDADAEKDVAADQRMGGQPSSATSCEQEPKREDTEGHSPRASTSGQASRHRREEREVPLIYTLGWTGETLWKPATELCLSKLVPDNAPTSHAANGVEPPVANGVESKLSPVPEEAMDASVSCEACLPKHADESSGTNGEDQPSPGRQEAPRESEATGVTEVSMESPDGTGSAARAAPSPETAEPAAGEEPRDISGASATEDSVPPEETEAMQS